MPQDVADGPRGGAGRLYMHHVQGPLLQTLHGSSLAWSFTASVNWCGESSRTWGGVGGPSVPRTSHGAAWWGPVWAVGPLSGWRTFQVSAEATPHFIPFPSRYVLESHIAHTSGVWGQARGCQKTLVDINVCSLQDLCVCFPSHFYAVFFKKLSFLPPSKDTFKHLLLSLCKSQE